MRRRLIALVVVGGLVVIGATFWVGQRTTYSSVVMPGPEGFIGEIIMVGFPFCPYGWADADGQLLNIYEHTALYSLYGTTYGGDGRTTFALPDLRGRVPIHTGHGPGLPEYSLGESGGSREIYLEPDQLPRHIHAAILRASSGGAVGNSPEWSYLAASQAADIYTDAVPDVKLGYNSVVVQENASQEQPIDNMPPYQTVRFCVCLEGVYPPRP